MHRGSHVVRPSKVSEEIGLQFRVGQQRFILSEFLHFPAFGTAHGTYTSFDYGLYPNLPNSSMK